MFRALSTRRSQTGYEKLDDESSSESLVPKLRRNRTVAAKVFNLSKNESTPTNSPARPKTPSKQVKEVSKIHPLFSLFDTRRNKKATAKPEFSRYIEYLKEGGAKADPSIIYGK